MRLLLDSHIILALLERRLKSAAIAELLESKGNAKFASVASLWEIAIKSRLGKLPLVVPLKDWPSILLMLGIQVIAVEVQHVLANIAPEPGHKDPFDRLLLGICSAEDLRLVTLDRVLAGHPLAWRPFPG